MKTAAQVTKKLAATGAENVRQIYLRQGAERAHGVPLAAVRALAGEIGTNHALALDLWKTAIHEERVVACMTLDPHALTEKEARALVASITYPIIGDELVSRVIAQAPFAEALGASFRDAKEDFARRAGWKILAERVSAGLERDVDAILDRLEREMPEAPFRAKEGMNFCLVQIGIRIPAHTERAVAIGEHLGVWDTRAIPKGCTSAYAPEWIGVILAKKHPAWKPRAAKAVALREEALKAAKAATKGGTRAPATQPRSKRPATSKGTSASDETPKNTATRAPRAKAAPSKAPPKKKPAKPTTKAPTVEKQPARR